MTIYLCKLKKWFDYFNSRQKVFIFISVVCILIILSVSYEILIIYASFFIAIMIFIEMIIRNNNEYTMQRALDNKRLIIEREPLEARLKLKDTRNKIINFSKNKSDDPFCVEFINKLLNDASELEEYLAGESLKIRNLMPIIDKISSLESSIEPRIGNGLIKVYFYKGHLEIEMYKDRKRMDNKDCINVMFCENDETYYITSRNIYDGYKNKTYYGEEKNIRFSNIDDSINYTIKSIANYCVNNSN